MKAGNTTTAAPQNGDHRGIAAAAITSSRSLVIVLLGFVASACGMYYVPKSAVSRPPAITVANTPERKPVGARACRPMKLAVEIVAAPIRNTMGARLNKKPSNASPPATIPAMPV